MAHKTCRRAGEGGISHMFILYISTSEPLLSGATPPTCTFGQDKKSFGDQGIFSFEQTIKRDDRRRLTTRLLIPRSAGRNRERSHLKSSDPHRVVGNSQIGRKRTRVARNFRIARSTGFSRITTESWLKKRLV